MKIFLFERNLLKFYTNNYIKFLCSTKSLFEMEEFLSEMTERDRISCGENILLHGVPVAGKSWTIAHEYRKANSKVERLVFHPDYTYAEFIGQIYQHRRSTLESQFKQANYADSQVLCLRNV